MKNKKGFTLVELLAVITLLAILMGIAVPNIVSTVNNSKRNEFLSDAKRMVSKAEYLLSLDKSARTALLKDPSTPKRYEFKRNSGEYLNKQNEFESDVDGGEYDSGSYVKITRSGSSPNYTFKYCICLVGSKRKIGAAGVDTCNSSVASTCVDSTALTGIDIVKDK